MAALVVVFVLVMIPLGFAAWTAEIAESRGRRPVPWAFLGLFTWFVGVVIAACLRPTPEVEARRLDEIAARRGPAPASEQLAELARLHRAGDLDDDEYALAKKRLLGS